MTDQQLSPDIFKGFKILAVDDEPDNLFVISRLLEMHGATVITGKNGEEGFEAAKEHLPIFIIADLSMPKVSGWQLLEMLRAEPSTKDIPVIALTAHAMAGDQDKVLKAGFDSYMTKPVIPYSFARDIVKVIYKIPSVFAKMAASPANGSADPVKTTTQEAKTVSPAPAKTTTQETKAASTEATKTATQEAKPVSPDDAKKATQESKPVTPPSAAVGDTPPATPVEDKAATPPASSESAGSNGASSTR